MSDLKDKNTVSLESKKGYLENIINWIIDHDSQKIKNYVERLRKQNIGISDIDLAHKIVSRESKICGLVGALTGLGGFITMPVTVPADIYWSFKTQAFMAYCISYIFGNHENTVDMKRDIYIIIAGDAAKEALKKFGIDITKNLTKKTIQHYLVNHFTNKIIQDIIAEFGREGAMTILANELAVEIVERAIAQSSKQTFNRFFRKAIPLVGAPIGYAFDWYMAKTVGNRAIEYYSGN